MKKDKILFVIPAYNEEDNIGKVLNEIKKDVNYADILVINDCSKDNTKKIVEENNVKCITNIFNVKYAMAVQTGIKYAYENGYDYVIQMDGDGQHIAKEAERLYHTMKKENTDINHIDGNKHNNRLSNLEEVSHQENMQKAADETNAWKIWTSA